MTVLIDIELADIKGNVRKGKTAHDMSPVAGYCSTAYSTSTVFFVIYSRSVNEKRNLRLELVCNLPAFRHPVSLQRVQDTL